MTTKPAINLWTSVDHAAEYLERAATIPHRTEGEAALLEFYLLPDGTGIADFSEALATATPSGIASEQLAIESIARTLEANVPQVKRLKILIHGQEVETLAGHLDLTGTFALSPALAQGGAARKP